MSGCRARNGIATVAAPRHAGQLVPPFYIGHKHNTARQQCIPHRQHCDVRSSRCLPESRAYSSCIAQGRGGHSQQGTHTGGAHTPPAEEVLARDD